MFLLHCDSKYIDILEKSLYNGLISGVGLDGKSFFYSNAMQIKNSFSHSAMEPSRAGWFECSCCPTNMTRLLPSIPGYVYAQKDQDIYVNLFVNSNATVSINGNTVGIQQQNNYPWQGALKFIVSPKTASTFGMKIRIPGWAKNEAIPSDLYRFNDNSSNKAEIKVNGQTVDYTIEKGYASINRTWKKGDVIEVNLPMDVRKVVANEHVKDDIGKVALQRGPIIYCAEWADNNGKVSNILMPSNSTFKTEFRPELLNGVTVIKSEVPVINIDPQGENLSTVKRTFTAIPYYSWANRGKGEMTVWFPEKVKDLDVITVETGENVVKK